MVQWLISQKMRPEDLLQHKNVELAAIGSGIDQQRLNHLLGRGVQLGFSVEEWQRNGIWVISRSDQDYPVRYKKHLKDKAPPLLFGVGDRSLLKGGGVAIVGSRNVDSDGENFTRNAADLCAYNKIPVISGGARGVDQIAMNAALDAGGITIGVLAENLLKKSLERKARNAISNRQLLLISPFHPNARFTVGTAMGRNKLIYALADYGLVVSADHKKGGTWAGATEELKRENSLTIFIRLGKDVPIGNKELMKLGALEWPKVENRENLCKQLTKITEQEPNNMNIFDLHNQNITQANEPKKVEKRTTLLNGSTAKDNLVEMAETTIYEVVLPVLIGQLETPMEVNELSKTLDVSKTQLNSWIKKAVSEGRIRKLLRPIRYEEIKTDRSFSDR